MVIRNKIFVELDNIRAIIFIVILIVVVYANSLANDFVADDYIVIVSNNFIKQGNNFYKIFSKDYLTSDSELGKIGEYEVGSGEASFRPVVTISYFLDYFLWGLNPFGYHLTNLFLHIINALLLYFFINLIAKDKKVSLLCSLLFALHPVNTEAVNVISFREDLLVFLFFISSFIFFIKSNHYLNKKTTFYFASMALFLLALFSKEMAVTLPIMLLIYDYFFVFSKNVNNQLRVFLYRYIGYVVILLLFSFIFTANIKEFSFKYSSGSFYINIEKLLDASITYFNWLINPTKVHFAFVLTEKYLPMPQRLFIIKLLFFMLIIICSIFVIKMRKTSKEIQFAILWFFVILFPVSNIIPMQNYMAARYLYLPMVGFCFLIATLLVKLPTLKIKSISQNALYKVANTMIIIILIFYSIFSVARNISFKNNIVFWKEIVEFYPKNTFAHIALGRIFSEHNLFNNAIEEYKKAINLSEKDTKAIAHEEQGDCYYKMGMLDMAEEEFKAALKLNGNLISAYVHLGCILGNKGLYPESISFLKMAIKIDPKNIDAYNNLGISYVKLKKWSEAMKAWKKVLEINSTHQAARNNIAKLKALGY